MAVLPDNKKPQPTSVSPVKPQRKGTGFTNLARVMQASQGSKLGQTIAGGITGQVQQVQSGIKTAQEEFQKEAEKNRVDTEVNRDRAAEAINAAGTTGVVNPEDLNLFRTIRAAEYKGPTELANQQQLQAQAQQAQTLGSLASGVGQRSGTDQGGRQELLRRFAGGADYTSGQRKLDESILSKDKESNLAAAARQTRGVAEEAQRAAMGAQAKGQEYGGLAKIFAKETQSKIDEAQKPISQELTEKVTQETKFNEDRKKFTDSLKNEMKTNEFLKKSKAEQNQYVTDYLKSGQNLFTPEQYDQIFGEGGYLPTVNKAVQLSSDVYNRLKAPASHNRDIAFVQKQERDLNMIPLYQRLQNYDPSAVFGSLDSSVAQNLNAQGVANAEQASKMNALDVLSGKTGQDLTFSNRSGEYKRTGFSSDILNEQQEQVLKDLYGISSSSKAIREVPNFGWDGRYATKEEIAKYLGGRIAGGTEAMIASEKEINDLYDSFMAKQDAKLRGNR